MALNLSCPLNQTAAFESALRDFEPPYPPTSGLPVPNPTTPFWLDPAANPLAKHGSEGDLGVSGADICIIGSGITGVSAAYHLSKLLAGSKKRVVILEARDFCSGATGRNGGHLTPNAFLHFGRQLADWGLDDAKRQLLLEEYTVEEILKIIHDHHLENVVDLVPGGHVSLLFTESEVQSAKSDYESAQKEGVDLRAIEWLDSDQVFARYGASHPGFFEPGHNLWPSKLVTELYNIARKSDNLKLDLFTSAPVTTISKTTDNSWKVHTPRGEITSKYIIHATNAYASHLLPTLAGRQGVIPTRGQVIATKSAVSLEQLTKVGWGGNEGFEYWFPRPVTKEGEKPLVILGGGREASGPEFELYQTDDSNVNAAVGGVLRKFLPEVFPGRYDATQEPEMEWSGIMGFTQSGDPFVGPAPGDDLKGQFISAGFSGHGMPRAFACAQAVAEMIVADIKGVDWTYPEWLPKHYLTMQAVGVDRTGGCVVA